MGQSFINQAFVTTEEVEKNTQKFEYSAGQLIYQGESAAGTATSSAGWSIKKYTYSGNDLVDIKWAGGTTAKINVWDDRATYTYS